MTVNKVEVKGEEEEEEKEHKKEKRAENPNHEQQF